MKKMIDFGRWFFVLPFLAFGFLHFGPLEFSLPYVPTWLPFPAFWVYFTGACFIAFALSAILKKYDKLAAVLLALCLFLFVVLIHIPSAMGGDFKSVIGAIRDVAMCGAALLYAGAYAKDNRIIGE
ncbi:MAG: hypothetical protein RL757_2502 [Bacteroidota bacterium]|jgi:uncharacterized membrane protein YphA (DoxX/SURF4 family)